MFPSDSWDVISKSQPVVVQIAKSAVTELRGNGGRQSGNVKHARFHCVYPFWMLPHTQALQVSFCWIFTYILLALTCTLTHNFLFVLLFTAVSVSCAPSFLLCTYIHVHCVSVSILCSLNYHNKSLVPLPSCPKTCIHVARVITACNSGSTKCHTCVR